MVDHQLEILLFRRRQAVTQESKSWSWPSQSFKLGQSLKRNQTKIDMRSAISTASHSKSTTSSALHKHVLSNAKIEKSKREQQMYTLGIV